MANIDFPELSFSSINCNSLNMSAAGKHNQIVKIYGVVKLKTDVIFMSDIRLCNRNLISCAQDVSKTFLINPYCSYTFIHNSSSSKRGVGILLKKCLNFTEDAAVRDPEDNFLAVRLTLQGNTFILCAIYGPNDYNPDFFQKIRNAINLLGPYPVVMGGDWNCTFDNSPIERNIDCLNMASVPNMRHSNLLHTLCADLDLTDPFRIFYPDRKDFSFVSKARPTRSRIDFFLTSNTINGGLTSCTIYDSMQNKMFDHKAITLSFVREKNFIFRPSVSNVLLKDSETDIYVWLAVSETYLLNTLNNHEIRDRGLWLTGQIRYLMRQCGINPVYICPENITEDLIATRLNLLNTVNILRLECDNLDIKNQDLSIEDDMFMEVLLNAIKNEMISYQSFIKKSKYGLRDGIILRLGELKSAHPTEENAITINTLECALNKIRDDEIRQCIESTPLFDHLHNEKMSPVFLKLAKLSNSGSSLSDIKQENGEVFNSNIDRQNFITNFYTGLYKIPDDAPDNVEGCIEEFLGPDILNHPIVLDSKLLPNESLALDSPLSMHELDRSVEEAKLNSAGGLDGINNRFIKKFWSYLKTPLLNYTHCCFRKGSLTDSFKTACIRLIPKKGCSSKIKNWRPISLINCIYKVISRAINNRLKKFADRFCSRAQKGYTSARHIQEVLINVLENIAFCKSNNVPGAVVAVDISKAFDTVLHSFMNEAYRFFGVGNTFISMMETLGSGRNACIIFEDNSTSKNFPLGTGRPQGDNTSPLQFNACEQILIFRIELDPRISSIFNHFFVPRPALVHAVDPNICRNFRNESQMETSKADVLADDTTTCTVLEFESLSTLKNILSEFGRFSGLKCNVEKSSILQIGNCIPVTEEINSLGFTFVDKFTLLGLDISNNFLQLQQCHDKTVAKIESLVRFWSRFKLSLPGRISISKTLLLSQVNYLGCIIMPTRAQLNAIANIVENFVKGTLPVAKNRYYIPPCQGGLGLINIEDFLIAQQAVWIKRAHLSTRDCWRFNLLKLCYGNCLIATPSLIPIDRHPILYGLVNSYDKFSKGFYSCNSNSDKAYIFYNSIFKREMNSGLILDRNFFANMGPAALLQIAKLQYSDFFNNGNFKSLDTLELDLGINFGLNTYMRIRTALHFFSTRQNAARCTESISLFNFLRRFKKGSRPFWKILASPRVLKTPIERLPTVLSFFRITNTLAPTPPQLTQIVGNWNMHFYPNKVRDFLYKFYNNCLGTNNRVAHFGNNVNPGCTFCFINNINPLPAENFLHIFLECPTVLNYHNKFKSEFFNNIVLSPIEEKNFWLLGEHLNWSQEKKINLFLFSAIFCFNFAIWECKLQKKIKSFTSLKMDYILMLKKVVSISPFIRSEKDKLNVALCRICDED